MTSRVIKIVFRELFPEIMPFPPIFNHFRENFPKNSVNILFMLQNRWFLGRFSLITSVYGEYR